MEWVYRHADDVTIEQVFPFVIATLLAFLGWWWVAFISLQPVVHNVVEELL